MSCPIRCAATVGNVTIEEAQVVPSSAYAFLYGRTNSAYSVVHLKFMGTDRIVFGSDSVWYGSPQWQIDAMWRFQIPEDLRKKYGYPELTEEAKRKILGLNSAKLYGINPRQQFKPVPKDYEKRMAPELRRIMELPAQTGDNLSKIKEQYVALGVEPDNTRYGWIRR
jgi:hypothetical protein